MSPTTGQSVLITTDAVGGVWTYSLSIARGFASHGWAVKLAVLGPSPDLNQITAARTVPNCEVLRTDLPLDWISPNAGSLASTAAELCGIAVRENVSRAHLHAPCLGNAAWQIPTVAVCHSCMASWWSSMRDGPLPPEFLAHASATQEGLSRVGAALAPSASFANVLHQIYRLERPFQVISNGTTSLPASKPARQTFILTAGRLWDEGKNIGILEDGAATLDIRAAGPVKSVDGARFKTDKISLLGNMPPDFLRATMARAGVFAAPSRYEPFGLVVLEAAQTGAPLALADIPTFRELWDDAAIFIPPNDPTAWRRELTSLLADEKQRAYLGRSAHLRAQSYTSDNMVSATLAAHAALVPISRQAA